MHLGRTRRLQDESQRLPMHSGPIRQGYWREPNEKRMDGIRRLALRRERESIARWSYAAYQTAPSLPADLNDCPVFDQYGDGVLTAGCGVHPSESFGIDLNVVFYKLPAVPLERLPHVVRVEA